MKKLITLLFALAVLTITVFMLVLPAAAEETVSYRYPVYKNNDPKQGIGSWEMGTVTNPQKVTSSDTQWNSGWYVVEGTIVINNSVKCKGNVNLILKSGSYLTINASKTDSAGIVVSDDKDDDGNVTSVNTLTIYTQSSYKGNAILAAAGGDDSAGIGGSDEKNGEHITINGGAIYAYGQYDAAGIGGGDSGGDGHDIIINDGYVAALGGCSDFEWYANGQLKDYDVDDDGAGIGGGWHGKGYDIIINGGTVEAYAGLNSAGIGGGSGASGYFITINDGDVTATGGEYEEEVLFGTIVDEGGAGIGGGSDGEGHDITINGGTVTAIGQYGGAGIGGGEEADGHDIKITGGTVIAKGNPNNSQGSAGIGGGDEKNGYNITISGGDVEATGGYGGAGIGGGCKGHAQAITINGGDVIAKGGKTAAGIGGGTEGYLDHMDINGGCIYAYGADGGAGIGGGDGFWGSNISLSGGYIEAYGGTQAAGIGGGRGGNGENIWIGKVYYILAVGNQIPGIGTGFGFDKKYCTGGIFVDSSYEIWGDGSYKGNGDTSASVREKILVGTIEIKTKIAGIENSNGTVSYYYNLNKAYKAASNGDTITLYADEYVAKYKNFTVDEGKTVNIDLNGHNIYGSRDGSTIINKGTLKITDSSEGSNGKIYYGYSDNGGVICNNGTMELSQITINGGVATKNGGNIYNSGDLTIQSCVVSNGTANYGGNISNHGTLTIGDIVTIKAGKAAYNGGNIYNDGDLTLYGLCSVSDGIAKYGGGVYNEGKLTMVGYEIDAGCGDGSTIKWRPTIENNTASDLGGGIFNTKEATFKYEMGVLSDNKAKGKDSNLVYYADTTLDMSIGAVQYTYIIDDNNNLTEVEYVSQTGSVFSPTSLGMIIAGGVAIISAAVAVIVRAKKKKSKPVPADGAFGDTPDETQDGTSDETSEQ